MARKSGGGMHHPSSRGGNRRKRQATANRKRTGERGMSRYKAKQTQPITIVATVPRIHSRFDGFMKVG